MNRPAYIALYYLNYEQKSSSFEYTCDTHDQYWGYTKITLVAIDNLYLCCLSSGMNLFRLNNIVLISLIKDSILNKQSPNKRMYCCCILKAAIDRVARFAIWKIQNIWSRLTARKGDYKIPVLEFP